MESEKALAARADSLRRLAFFGIAVSTVPCLQTLPLGTQTDWITVGGDADGHHRRADAVQLHAARAVVAPAGGQRAFYRSARSSLTDCSIIDERLVCRLTSASTARTASGESTAG